MHDIILDLDTGIDDALALACVLACSSELNLLAVSTTFGNVSTRTSGRNSAALLHHLGCDDIPVVTGSRCPLGSHEVYEASAYQHRIHGENGIGGADLPAFDECILDEDVVAFYDRMLHTHEDVTLVTTGPMTNLAAFLMSRPDRMFSRVVSMGGAVYTDGNITPWAEANIYKDTRAASIVLDSVPNLVLVPLDVTQTLFLSKEEVGSWNDGQYREMTDFYIAFHGGDRCFLHDPTTIAYLAHPDRFRTEMLSLEVVQDGQRKGNLARRQTGTGIDVVVSCDADAVQTFLYDAWKRILC